MVVVDKLLLNVIFRDSGATKENPDFLFISFFFFLNVRSGYQEDTKDRLAQGEEVSLQHIIRALGGN